MSERAAGNIYDLGYRNYRGVRLGRRHALFALYVHSLRGVFGIGRGISSKVFPIGLAIVILVPAAFQLGIAAIADNTISLFKAEDYYGYVQIILALFCTAVAPELVGRDQRTQTLALYFSRALKREDYALAKWGALVTAMLVLTVVPQAVLFVGNGMAQNDLAGYLGDEWEQVPAILISALLLSTMTAGIGLAIAAQTSRRAYSSVAILATFVLSATMATILLEATDPELGRFALLLSPFHLVRGFTLWFFGVSPGTGSHLARADLPGAIYAMSALLIASLTVILLLRRYQRISA